MFPKKSFYHQLTQAVALCMTIVLLSWGTTAHARIYKWLDENGQVHYGSQPQPDSQSVEQIKIRKNSTTSPRISKEDLAIDAINRQEAEAERKKQQALQPEPVKPTIPASEKRRLCKQAREDYSRIMSRGRMREKNSKGEYVYLTETQRQQRLQASKNRQKKYCH